MFPSTGRYAVKLLRRAIMALTLAGMVAATLRLRGKGGTPPQQGGWRELDITP
jgi:alpha-beta hydrolase superfamily lysophospholipase